MKYIEKILILLIIAGCHVFVPLVADNRIIIYLKHAPEAVLQEAELEAKKSGLIEKIKNNIDTATPGQNSQKLTHNALRSYMKPPLSGLVAQYGGYTDMSNVDGLISFPQRHAAPKLYLAITPEVGMVKIKDNTYSHREYIDDPKIPVQLYQFQLKQDEKKHWYWDVTEEKIPTDKKVNPLTVVILTDPKNIYVPVGHFQTTHNTQLIIPDIYLIGRLHNEEILLRHLVNWEHVFESIAIEQKRASDYAIQTIITNL